MEREGALITHYPLLIQKTLADKLSDKVQGHHRADARRRSLYRLESARRAAGSAAVILALAAALAIIVQDHTPLRSAPQSGATELTTLWQGDVLEVRGQRAGYLQVYDHRRERGGYLRNDAVRPLGLTADDAPQLLTVLRFLRDSRGSEALGISYGAAYLKAVPSQALTAEPMEAIASMAERLADAASGGAPAVDVGAHLDVVGQFGVRMRSFERNGRMQVCYDGELFHRVLTSPRASAEERALAALSLTRPDCIDPALGPAPRAALDHERSAILDGIAEGDLTPLTLSRLHARRAAVWASVAFAQTQHGESATAAGQRALAELLAVQVKELGEDRKSEYTDAAVRVSANRWAATAATKHADRLTVSPTPGDPGQTCIALQSPTPGCRTARAALYLRYCVASVGAGDRAGPGSSAGGATLGELARAVDLPQASWELDCQSATRYR